MNPGLPNNVRKAMAKQAVAGLHPEPSLLNAYAERMLSPAEDTEVAGHLATCTQCRSVMFLAHSAADQPIEVRETVAPVRTTWFRWAMPATAALAIAIALVTFKQTDLRSPASAPRQSAQVLGVDKGPASQDSATPEAKPEPAINKPAPAIAGKRDTRESAAATPAGKPVAKHALATKPASTPAAPPPMMSASPATSRALNGALASNTQNADLPNLQSPNNAAARGPSQRMQNQMAASNVEVAPASQTVEVQASEPTVATVPAANAAPQETIKSSGVGALAYSNPSAADTTAKRSALSRMASQVWRISSDGHLERMMQNQWHRALNGVQKSFRVVAYVQDHVWAGGSGPELFHSADGGDNWNTINVKTADSEFNGTMQTIRASDAQHLAIVADDGSTWTTSDGGQTWAKQ